MNNCGCTETQFCSLDHWQRAKAKAWYGLVRGKQMIKIEADFEAWAHNPESVFTLTVRVRDFSQDKYLTYEKTYPLDFYRSHFERIWKDIGMRLQESLPTASETGEGLHITREK